VHELSIMNNILDIVLENANKNNAQKVVKVNLKIGDLSDIIPEWAQTYFDMLSKDTIADGASIAIEKVPVTIKCRSCGNMHTFKNKNWSFSCTSCSSNDIEIIEGRELFITSIEIE
jgi:hydrogenase nickel incorporation protein HypA/HybF